MFVAIRTCLIMTLIPVLGYASPALAQQVPEDCTAIFLELFSDDAFGQGSRPTELTAVGTRVAFAEDSDRHSFTMNVAFRPSTPLDTQRAADQSTFTLRRIGSPNGGGTLRFNGPSREVFPGRGNSTSERPSLVIFGEQSPNFQVVVVYSAANNAVELNGLTCFRSFTDNDFIMTGYGSESDGTFGFYSFMLRPEFN